MENKAMIYSSNKLELATYDSKKSYEFIRGAVDGYIERIPLREFDKRHIDVWCNEEGKLRNDLDYTALLVYEGNPYDVVVGSLVFTRSTKGGKTVSLTDDDIEFIKKTFADAPYVIDSKLTFVPLVELNY